MLMRISIYLVYMAFGAFLVTLHAPVALAQTSVAHAKPIPDIVGIDEKTRIFIFSDIGNEPDDQMSLVRFLLYSHQFDIEGLTATTSTWQRDVVRPDIIHTVLDSFEKVWPQLQDHETGWPTLQELRSVVYTGPAAYGIEGISTEAPSSGALAFVEAALKDDPRPLWINLWGGANAFGEGLLLLKDRLSHADLDSVISKLRVYSISDQDDAGPWIRAHFPNISYIVHPSSQNGEDYLYATWTGISGDAYYKNGAGADFSIVSNAWLEKNIRSKGPLGKAYPAYYFIMEGDTPAFLHVIRNGLSADQNPGWGGWGGRYVRRQPRGEAGKIWTQGGDMFDRHSSRDTVKGRDGREYHSDQATIWRWREDFQNDFAARMDWTIKSREQANHAPTLVVNGEYGTRPLIFMTRVGDRIILDANGSSDPDGDQLAYEWISYPEANSQSGDGQGVIEVMSPTAPRTAVKIISHCRPYWMELPNVTCPSKGEAHVILKVRDNNNPALTSYRRVIFVIDNNQISTHSD